MFSATNTPLITLFQNLGLKSLRIGGATVDMPTVAIPTNTDIDHLFAFAQAAGVKVIYSLRLLNGSTSADAAAAKYIWTHYRARLDSFAVGNEPDWNSYHQSDPNITNYTSYLANWQKFATTITRAVPGATFSGRTQAATLSRAPRTTARDRPGRRVLRWRKRVPDPSPALHSTITSAKVPAA